MLSNNSVIKQNNKLLCQFGRGCFTDSSICGYIGYYVDCPKNVNSSASQHFQSGDER